MTRQPILLSWSTGKDSAWTLALLREDPDVEVVGLLTTTNETRGRVSMHAVREELLALQARAVGLPLRVVALPDPCPNVVYEARMRHMIESAREDGITGVAFGDLFLADVRDYRERQMAGTGLRALFPLWGRDTRELADEMVRGGLRAILTCVDPKQCPTSFAGREFDAALLAELPPGIDPCGENGEFHSFAWDGPMFREAIRVRRGAVVERDGFVFADLLPAGR